MLLEGRIKLQARALGFDLCGIAAAEPSDGFERLQDWLARGCAGEMAYMSRYEEAYRHPAGILPKVRSVIMLALNYSPKPDDDSAGVSASHGKIARYARGADYHDVIRGKLNRLLAWIQREMPGIAGRGVVDTAPLLERAFARRAGLGWFGKNTMLINKKLGSYFFLAALLVDAQLKPDMPFSVQHCGTCTACLDACPTQAFPSPGLLDARLCISYLTIELRGSIPSELRQPMGDWLFGCDICQEVCPWNRKAPPGSDPELNTRPDLEALDLTKLMGLSEQEFRRQFRDTALWRGRRRGLLRNAAIVLGNQGDPSALLALEQALADPEPLVREAAAWAIKKIKERSQ